MILLGSIHIAMGIVFFILSVLFFTVSIVLNRLPKQVGKTRAELSATKHRKDVTLYSKNSVNGPWHKTGFIKHLTKATYLYTVQGKTYKIRDDQIGTPHQTPRFVSVVYLKRFPRFSYLNDVTSFTNIRYTLYSLVLLAWAIIVVYFGISIL